MRNSRTWFCTLLCVLSILPSVASAYDLTAGRVMDYLTRKPIEGAIVTGENEIVRTGSDGMFLLRNATAKVGIRAYGYARGEQTVPALGAMAPFNIYLRPFVPKALYLTYYGIGDRSLRESALNLVK